MWFAFTGSQMGIHVVALLLSRSFPRPVILCSSVCPSDDPLASGMFGRKSLPGAGVDMYVRRFHFFRSKLRHYCARLRSFTTR